MQDFIIEIKAKQPFNVRVMEQEISKRFSDNPTNVTVSFNNLDDPKRKDLLHIMIKDDEPSYTEDDMEHLVDEEGRTFFKATVVMKIVPWERR